MTMRDPITGVLIEPGDPIRVRVSIDGGEQNRMVPGFNYVGPGSTPDLAIIEILGEQLEAPHDAVALAGKAKP